LHELQVGGPPAWSCVLFISAVNFTETTIARTDGAVLNDHQASWTWTPQLGLTFSTPLLGVAGFTFSLTYAFEPRLSTAPVIYGGLSVAALYDSFRLETGYRIPIAIKNRPVSDEEKLGNLGVTLTLRNLGPVWKFMLQP
jgi:hypothetical protein